MSKKSLVFLIVLGLAFLFFAKASSLFFTVFFGWPIIVAIAIVWLLANKIEKSSGALLHLKTGIFLGVIILFLLFLLNSYLKVFNFYGGCQDYGCAALGTYTFVILIILGGLLGIPIALLLKSYQIPEKSFLFFIWLKAKTKSIIAILILLVTAFIVFSGYLGIGLNNPLLCSLSATRNFKGRCYSDIAIATRNPQLCQKILDINEAYHYNCIVSIAWPTGNMALCDSIKEEKYINICKSRIAENNEDPEICKKLSNEESYNSCIRGIAWRKHDKSICNILEKQEDKDICIKSF